MAAKYFWFLEKIDDSLAEVVKIGEDLGRLIHQELRYHCLSTYAQVDVWMVDTQSRGSVTRSSSELSP
jgi:hypothetical protein